MFLWAFPVDLTIYTMRSNTILTIDFLDRILLRVKSLWERLMKLDFWKVHYESGTIEIKNIVDPIIKIGAFVIIPVFILFLGFSAITKTPSYSCIGISIVMVYLLFFGFIYIYFAIKDPDRLQSEKTLLELRKMESSKYSKPIDVSTQSVIARQEPLNQLPDLQADEAEGKE